MNQIKSKNALRYVTGLLIAISILLVSQQSLGTSIPYSVSDTTKPLTVTQVDSLIKFSEYTKTLRDKNEDLAKQLGVITYLWEQEQKRREKDSISVMRIMGGYETSQKNLTNAYGTLEKKYKGQVRKNRTLFLALVASLGYAFIKTVFN
jgi:hypothetical protein